MKFIDEAIIEVHAGNGGDGCARVPAREVHPARRPERRRRRPRRQHLRGRRPQHQHADRLSASRASIARKNGENGRGADCYGRGAEDIVLRMPVGTVITDAETGELIADLPAHGETALLAKGGKGGLGNLHFKSSTNRAPRQFTPRRAGRAAQAASSSSRCWPTSACSACRTPASPRSSARCRPRARRSPTIRSPRCIRTSAWCASTTSRSFVIADIPGLIEGAAEGAGLGHQFLRHLQRTRLLLHLVDIAPFDEDADPVARRAGDRQGAARNTTRRCTTSRAGWC